MWRILGVDRVTVRLRERITNETVLYWLECPWCSGLVYTAAVTYLVWLSVGFPYPVVTGLLALTVTGIIGERV